MGIAAHFSMETIIVIGAVLGIVRVGAMGLAGPMWMYKWFRPKRPDKTKRIARRLGFTLAHSYRMVVLHALRPLRLPAILVFVAWCFSKGGYHWQPVAGFTITYLSIVAGATAFGLFKNYRLKLLGYAAHEVAHRLPPAQAEELLLPFARAAKGDTITPAIGAMRDLGTPEAIETLQTLAYRNALGNETLTLAADNAQRDLSRLALRETPPLHVGRMAKLVFEHEQLYTQIVKRKKTWYRRETQEGMDAIIEQMDEIVFSQLPLRRSFPAVYCKDCYSRGERMTYESWDWVRCRSCKEATGMYAGVQQIIGQIGGQDDWLLENGVLKVSLWDDVARKARAAQIDALEVLGGHDIQYDWAVGAVVQVLHNHSADASLRIPVRLSNAPALDANSLRLLQTLDAGMRNTNKVVV